MWQHWAGDTSSNGAWVIRAYQGDSKDTSFNLNCGLKGINPSKIDPMGGVDLAGFEPSPTKTELSDRVAFEISTLDEGIALGDTALNKQGLESLNERPANIFRETIVIASRRIKDLRDYVAGKEYAVGKLLARSGEEKVNDWTKTMKLHDETSPARISHWQIPPLRWVWVVAN